MKNQPFVSQSTKKSLSMTHAEIIDLMLEDLQKSSAVRHNTLGVVNFKTQMKWLGVSSLQLKEIASAWIRLLHDFTSKQWADLCIQLTQTGVFEAQILAYVLLWENKKALRDLTAEQVLALGAYLDNWASTDSYSIMIAGWHWREGTIPDSQITKWLKSKNIWQRRAAVVCTVPLNLRSRGGTGDAKRTLFICEKVLDDREDLIVKALSWALRELSKSNKQAVIEFLEKHGERVPSRVRREVTAKLGTGRKNG